MTGVRTKPDTGDQKWAIVDHPNIRHARSCYDADRELMLWLTSRDRIRVAAADDSISVGVGSAGDAHCARHLSHRVEAAEAYGSKTLH